LNAVEPLLPESKTTPAAPPVVAGPPEQYDMPAGLPDELSPGDRKEVKGKDKIDNTNAMKITNAIKDLVRDSGKKGDISAAARKFWNNHLRGRFDLNLFKQTLLDVANTP